ncbi:DUF3558 domain-containing protein [Allosaccharopolyspora coralli]|uniref:DUF3558 domain-containing protein n=1 Tax=Allosaccharopolyspora coralli TaxID=2665642 RepID=A0A5Q3Q902_9PSEU|nr:DUF3558 family protein [Allosaccharopolyspora coralli]QGK69684.1 DUF3558 domain-containing protein [Allosaccharopolyspora coralli]
MNKERRTGSVRKAIVAASLLLVAGCSGGATTEPPPSPPPTTNEAPVRSAPAKSIEVPDRCSVVTEPQWRQLGATDSPREREVGEGEGIVGCDYSRLNETDDWQVFVSAVPKPLPELAERTSLREPLDFSGYPAMKRSSGDVDCIIAFDVADGGTLLVQSQVLEGSADPCQLTSGFAEAALSNLPDAPGGQ